MMRTLRVHRYCVTLSYLHLWDSAKLLDVQSRKFTVQAIQRSNPPHSLGYCYRPGSSSLICATQIRYTRHRDLKSRHELPFWRRLIPRNHLHEVWLHGARHGRMSKPLNSAICSLVSISRQVGVGNLEISVRSSAG